MILDVEAVELGIRHVELGTVRIGKRRRRVVTAGASVGGCQ